MPRTFQPYLITVTILGDGTIYEVFKLWSFLCLIPFVYALKYLVLNANGKVEILKNTITYMVIHCSPIQRGNDIIFL